GRKTRRTNGGRPPQPSRRTSWPTRMHRNGCTCGTEERSEAGTGQLQAMRRSPMKSSGDPGARRLKSWGIHGEPECHQCAPRDEPNETKLSGAGLDRACSLRPRRRPLERVVRPMLRVTVELLQRRDEPNDLIAV